MRLDQVAADLDQIAVWIAKVDGRHCASCPVSFDGTEFNDYILSAKLLDDILDGSSVIRQKSAVPRVGKAAFGSNV